MESNCDIPSKNYDFKKICCLLNFLLLVQKFKTHSEHVFIVSPIVLSLDSAAQGGRTTRPHYPSYIIVYA
jgi:hypothetical protein